MKPIRGSYGCPVELCLAVLGGKWTTVILAWLKEGPLRYGELRRLTPGLSDKVLGERLKELEAAGLVIKMPLDGGSRRLYGLTERGESLRPVLDALYGWGSVAAETYDVGFTTPARPPA